MNIKMKPIDVNADGLAMFLGPLEAACMRAIWAYCSTTKAIWRHVRENYETPKTEEIAYTSVSTTVYRLWQQGYVTRIGDKNTGFTYTPFYASESVFVSYHIRIVINALVTNYPREAGQVIIERLRADATKAKKLERQ